jgi:hypothetical protein
MTIDPTSVKSHSGIHAPKPLRSRVCPAPCAALGDWCRLARGRVVQHHEMAYHRYISNALQAREALVLCSFLPSRRCADGRSSGVYSGDAHAQRTGRPLPYPAMAPRRARSFHTLQSAARAWERPRRATTPGRSYHDCPQHAEGHLHEYLYRAFSV